MKKIFLFFFLILSTETLSKEITNKTKIQVGNEIITEHDILIEKNWLFFINSENKNNISANIIEEIAQNNLIARKIKKLETDNFKVNADKSEVDNELFNFLKTQNLSEDKVYNFTKNFKINENYLRETVELEIKWKNLIRDIYSGRINVNVTEIDQQIQKNNIPLTERENIIAAEKNKILNSFLSNHLEISKKKYLIKVL
ncbi:MAG: hypothetical protein ACKO5H_02390 [Candidatus Fonsibacter sp.]